MYELKLPGMYLWNIPDKCSKNGPARRNTSDVMKLKMRFTVVEKC